MCVLRLSALPTLPAISVLAVMALVVALQSSAAEGGRKKAASGAGASVAAKTLDPATATPGIPADNLKGLELVKDGEGKDVFLARCTACHALTDVVSKRKTRPQWDQRVREMVDLGAKVPPDDMKIIINYLATNYSL